MQGGQRRGLVQRTRACVRLWCSRLWMGALLAGLEPCVRVCDAELGQGSPDLQGTAVRAMRAMHVLVVQLQGAHPVSRPLSATAGCEPARLPAACAAAGARCTCSSLWHLSARALSRCLPW